MVSAMPNTTGPRLLRAILSTAVCAVALVALAACSDSPSSSKGDGAKSGDASVASIPSASSTAGSSAKVATDPDAGRPQIRLDSSDEEINRLNDVYGKCLMSHGAPGLKVRPDSAAAKACASKQPLEPPELSPATNPNYSDDVRAMIKCMNAHGIKAVATPDGGWGTVDGASMNAPNFSKTYNNCQLKSFGGDK